MVMMNLVEADGRYSFDGEMLGGKNLTAIPCSTARCRSSQQGMLLFSSTRCCNAGYPYSPEPRRDGDCTRARETSWISWTLITPRTASRGSEVTSNAWSDYISSDDWGGGLESEPDISKDA